MVKKAKRFFKALIDPIRSTQTQMVLFGGWMDCNGRRKPYSLEERLRDHP
jgi:hypothetical protein